MNDFIRVYSEIGPLKRVLLHRPGKELERLMPQYLERMLFDDIPFLKSAQKEHDEFAAILKKEGTEVLYLRDLLLETVKEKEVRDNLIEKYCDYDIPHLGQRRVNLIKAYLKEMNSEDAVERLMTGILKKEVPNIVHPFYDRGEGDDPFLMDPLPNLYFTRDPAAAIGNGISVSKMKWEARAKETLFMTAIMKHHPSFIKNGEIPCWHKNTDETNIEGGDELVLAKDTLAIGVSQRTNPVSVERLALNLFNSDNGFKKVYGVVLPSSRVFMHLDTVFTMVDKDKFVMHPAVMTGVDLKVFCLEPATKNTVKITEEKDLFTMLSKIINDKPTLIPCGGGDFIDAAREQWNDGSNTLAIAPGVVVTYARNELSNKALEDHGIKVHSFPGPELVRGRGGPRCMSMPLYRDDY